MASTDTEAAGKCPYSDSEIQELKHTLQERWDNLKKDVDNIAREHSDGNPGNLAEDGEQVSHNFEQGRDYRIRERELKLMRKIEKAIAHIDDGSYGICTDCQQWIRLERLKARPVTELCFDCKEEQEYLEKMETGS